MNSYQVESKLKDATAQTVAAGATTAVSNVYGLSAADARNHLVKVTFSAIGETTGASVALQDSPDGSTWTTHKSAALASVANVDTITFPALASITGGDYFVVYDTAGNAWAGAMNKSGADAAPTGAIYTAVNAARKVNIDVSGATSGADVAALVKTAMEALTGWAAAFTITDPADGTLVFTAKIAGVNSTAPVRKNADDSGNGSLTATATTAGSFTASYELEVNILNTTDTSPWPTVRIVVVTQTGDTATVSDIIATRRI